MGMNESVHLPYYLLNWFSVEAFAGGVPHRMLSGYELRRARVCLPSRDLTQNQGHSHGRYHQFHQPSERIRRSNCGVHFDEQRIADE